jgi:hypothetical protein
MLAAFLHGFVSLELAGALRPGGGIEDSFDSGLRLLLAAVLPAVDTRVPPR